MSPEKIAIAVAVTIAAMAGIGAMKNVTGTSNAVAIVAVSPGTAPTNNPNNDAANITHRLYGSNTIWNARAMSCTSRPRDDDGIDDAQKANRSSTPHGSGTRNSL